MWSWWRRTLALLPGTGLARRRPGRPLSNRGRHRNHRGDEERENAFSFPTPSVQRGLGTLELSLSWELDFWGRLRRLTESARAQYLASEEGRRAVLVSLVADVATAYFQLRDFDLELLISRRTVTSRQQGLGPG